MKISAIYFLLAYILLVPLFGIIYNTMPLEFYHSTNKYEKHHEKDKSTIQSEFESALVLSLKKVHEKSVIENTGIYFDIDALKIVDMFIENGEVRFQLYDLYFDTLTQSGSGMTFNLGFNLSDLNPPDTLENNEILMHRFICAIDNAEKDEENKLRIKDIFNQGHLNFKWSETVSPVWTGKDCGSVFLPKNLFDKMLAFDLAMKGFPSYSSGNLERMIYFSAMIITTVGLGDIVPLSIKARFLVTLEALIGIIIIGLFLNSLASKMKSE